MHHTQSPCCCNSTACTAADAAQTPASHALQRIIRYGVQGSGIQNNICMQQRAATPHQAGIVQEFFPADIVLGPQLPRKPHSGAKVEQPLPPNARAIVDLQRCLDALINLPFLRKRQAATLCTPYKPCPLMSCLHHKLTLVLHIVPGCSKTDGCNGLLCRACTCFACTSLGGIMGNRYSPCQWFAASGHAPS